MPDGSDGVAQGTDAADETRRYGTIEGVFGFRDGWLAIFPGHPLLAVDAAMLTVLVAIVLISTKAAFRTQFVILGIVAVALGSIGLAVFTQPWVHTPPTFGAFPGAAEDGFPGADVWLAYAAPTSELVSNYFAIVDLSAWSPAVLAGLLAATFSSALAALVGAPRILQALAAHRVTPAASWLTARDGRGEPGHALLVTITIVAAAVLPRALDRAAAGSGRGRQHDVRDQRLVHAGRRHRGRSGAAVARAT